MDLQYVSRARGGKGPSTRMEDAVTLVADAIPSGISEVLAPTFFLRNYLPHQSPWNRTVNAVGGRLYVLCDAAEY